MSLAIGVTGAGVMGAEHARLLREDVRGAHLAAGRDADPSRAAAAARGAATFSDPAALIAAVEAVVITNPDATHADLALACLAAGSPVLREKPLAATAAEALRVVQAEAALGRRLVLMGYMRRFDPADVQMHQAGQAGNRGRLVLLHNIHRNQAARNWVRGALPITDSLKHEIDTSRWLPGDDFTGATLTVGPGGDPMQVVLQTATGTFASTEVFMNAGCGFHVHAELVGQAVSLAMVQPTHTLLNQADRHGHAWPARWVPRFAEAYRMPMNVFVAGVKSGPRPSAMAWVGFAATAIAEQIVPALGHGQPVTPALPAEPALYAQGPSQ